MPEIIAPTPPPEITVAQFAEAEKLPRWQLDALMARAGIALNDRRPIAALKAALHDALHGRL